MPISTYVRSMYPSPQTQGEGAEQSKAKANQNAQHPKIGALRTPAIRCAQTKEKKKEHQAHKKHLPRSQFFRPHSYPDSISNKSSESSSLLITGLLSGLSSPVAPAYRLPLTFRVRPGGGGVPLALVPAAGGVRAAAAEYDSLESMPSRPPALPCPACALCCA